MTTSSSNKRIVIIAGPNGAGKTTFAREFLPNEANCPVFVKAISAAIDRGAENPETSPRADLIFSLRGT